VTGRRFARKYGYLDRLRKLIEKEGLIVHIYDKVEPNPSFETVNKGAEFAKNINIDVIVAIGGGSVIDAAKGIAILCTQGGNIQDYVYSNVVKGDVLPIVAIPTLDSLVLRHLPPELTAYTTLNALSHALEAYWPKASQPISDLLSPGGIRLIITLDHIVHIYLTSSIL